jgi:AraC-like DNA-binding protein
MDMTKKTIRNIMTFEQYINEVRRVVEYIDAHFQENGLTPEQVGLEIEMAQNRVAEILWHAFNMTFEEYRKARTKNGPMLTHLSDDDIPLHIPPTIIDIEAGQLKNYFYNHYQESDLSLEKVAREVRISPSTHITIILQKKFSMTFPQYLNNIRIKAAQKLLCITDLAIIEIALNVGYNNISHFNRVFHRIEGCPPSAFRDRHGMKVNRIYPNSARSAEFAEMTANFAANAIMG